MARVRGCPIDGSRCYFSAAATLTLGVSASRDHAPEPPHEPTAMRDRRSLARRPRVEAMEPRRLPSTLTVDTTADAGAGSLRQAILDAAAGDTIAFAIPGTGVRTIAPATELPPITVPLTIDGTTQPGYAGTPLIELSGAAAGRGVDGLRITGGGSTVRGLAINRFRVGPFDRTDFNSLAHGGFAIEISGPGGNVIEGDFLGTNSAGTADLIGAQPLGNSFGVHILNSPGNTVGGTTVAARDVISGNSGDSGNPLQPYDPDLLGNGAGIIIDGVGSTGNVVEGDFIGTDVTGARSVPNNSGVILFGTSGNTVGGTAPGAGNVLSGNYDYDVWMKLGSTGNVVQGNFVGTNASGSRAVAYSGTLTATLYGVFISEGSAGNTVGGTAPGASNVISGNGGGVAIAEPGIPGNLIQGNYIGTDASGTIAVGNISYGVSPAAGTTIGGTAPGAGNLISGNGTGIGGVSTFAAYLAPDLTGLVVQGNLIGTDATGTRPLPNHAGIGFDKGAGVTIGGAAPGAGNVIAYNSTYGIGTFGSNPAILANSIHDNAGLGIDILEPYSAGFYAGDLMALPGVNPNLPQGARNDPVLTSVATSAAGTTVAGTLNSTPTTPFTIQLYADDRVDPTGYGQGRTYLGATTVTNDDAGNAAFSATFPAQLTPGQFVAATSTGPGGTSEFSRAIEITAPAPADLSLAQVATSGGGIGPGGQISYLTYTLTVTNHGPNPATNVQLFDNLPPMSFATPYQGPGGPPVRVISAGLTYLSGSASQGTVALAGTNAVADLGTLAPGATVTVKLVVLPQSFGPATNPARVVADQVDPNPADNAATTTTQVALAVVRLHVTLAGPAGPVPVGVPLTYTLTVRNAGPNDAFDAHLYDFLPPGATVVSTRPGQGAVTAVPGGILDYLGNLPAGASATLVVVVRPAGPGGFKDIAYAAASPRGDFSQDGTALITPVVPLTSATTLSASSVAPVGGQLFTLSAAVVLDGRVAPGGRVTFQDGTRVLGTAPIGKNGRASLAVRLAPGRYVLAAVFDGSATAAGSRSLRWHLTVPAPHRPGLRP